MHCKSWQPLRLLCSLRCFPWNGKQCVMEILMQRNDLTVFADPSTTITPACTKMTRMLSKEVLFGSWISIAAMPFHWVQFLRGSTSFYEATTGKERRVFAENEDLSKAKAICAQNRRSGSKILCYIVQSWVFGWDHDRSYNLFAPSLLCGAYIFLTPSHYLFKLEIVFLGLKGWRGQGYNLALCAF